MRNARRGGQHPRACTPDPAGPLVGIRRLSFAVAAAPSLADPVLAEVVAEVARVDPEEDRGLPFPSLRAREGAQKDLLLGRVEVPPEVQLALRGRAGGGGSGLE